MEKSWFVYRLKLKAAFTENSSIFGLLESKKTRKIIVSTQYLELLFAEEFNSVVIFCYLSIQTWKRFVKFEERK
jgi:hypothetical protein